MEFKYRGLSATLDRHTVTDAEVDTHIQRLLQQNPRVAEVTDRPAAQGDEVILDYAGFCDGVQFPGGTGENQALVLGSGMFIPGFEEQLIDKVPGEEVTVKVTFPKEYHAEELAGKDAEFRCVIKSIRIKDPYELDDTFAKEVGGCENLQQMRQKLQESLQAYTDERGEMDLQDRLLQQASETLDFTCPQEKLDDAVNEQMKTFEAQLTRQGLSLEMYCSFMNTTQQELLEEMVPSAKTALRRQAAIDRIVELEKLEATDEEIGQAIALVARQNDMTVEQLKPYYNEDFRQAIIKSVLTGKVMALIREHATVTVVS
ncbi:MAG: trigger factor [Oscillospiraceae bacterium]|nr:trigger factor [Oscillospiraceae bacterium]